MTDINRPLLGDPNAPCRTCGSPLAADQRYCLQCGARRAEARLPFLDILAQQVPQGAGAPAATGPAASPPSNWLGRMSTNTAAVAGVACLLLALGVGVLIGGLGQNDSAASATPQVISVGSAAPAAAAAAPSVATPALTETTGDTTTTTPKDTAKTKSSKKTASTTKAGNNAVKNLDSSAGGDYAKKSEKLPKTLGTGGKAPPVDKSKPAGGGSDVESIG
ncbi:MAG TPA: hypothetical protein VFY45_09080 [Baekduia sp.]|nr:hypothetical protein [Baekduia sp.]